MADQLTDDAEVLFRHVHPNFLHDGEPSSSRFMPSEKDQNRLSLDRSSLITAQKAFELFTSTGKKCAAVFGLTVAEFGTENVPCVEDPIANDPDLPDNPAHALADYSAHESARHKLIAKRLKNHALKRGCLYKPS